MSAKKSLLALAVLAIAMMGFSSSAMAGGGKVVHEETGTPIGEGEKLHFEGWASFIDPSDGTGLKCHVEADVETINAETGAVTNFDAKGNDTDWCTTFGDISHCEVATNGAVTTNLPYHLTATPTDFDVEEGESGPMVIDTDLDNFLCPEIELTVDSPLTLKPLETGGEKVTGTAGNVGEGNTAEAGDPLAGVEFTGSGITHDFTGTREVHIEGELEVTGSDLCTWELAES